MRIRSINSAFLILALLLALPPWTVAASAAENHSDVPPIVLPNVAPKFLSTGSSTPDRLVPQSGPLPMTGFTAPGPAYKKLDQTFCDYLKKWDIPGGSITIAKNGKVLMSRGYGWADIHKDVKVQPDSLFRIASISKAITAVAIAKLVEQKKLSMDDSAFDILKFPWPAGTRRDPRLADITIRDLLQCTAGWDRSKSGDPIFSNSLNIAADKYSHSLRPSAKAIVRLQMEKPLDFLPGTHFAYSNVCYTVLGLVIEKVSGKKYEDYVKSEVLAPMGIHKMRVGKTLMLAPGEVVHYPFPGQQESASIYPNFTGMVPATYGSTYSMETMCADAGWLASTEEMTKFMAEMFGETGTRPISKESFDDLLTWPKDIPEWQSPKVVTYFAKGWQVVPKNKHGVVVYREGCLPGGVAVVMHRADGVSWSFALNSRPMEFFDCQIKITKAIWQCVNAQE